MKGNVDLGRTGTQKLIRNEIELTISPPCFKLITKLIYKKSKRYFKNICCTLQFVIRGFSAIAGVTSATEEKLL